MNIAILVLAAGGSSRLGQPKQLIDIGGTSLLHHIVSECLESKTGDVHVILGAYKDSVQKIIGNLSCKIIHHKGWKAGLASSIAFGVKEVSTPSLDGVIIVLADQPYFTRQLLLDIVSSVKNSPSPIVACRHEKGTSPPVYFDSDYFDQLSSLEGDDGAKSILKENNQLVAFVSFPKGYVDIDTPEDLELLPRF